LRDEGKKKSFLFPGFCANLDQSNPKRAKSTGEYPWKGCVSKEWIAKTQCKIAFPEDDTSVSVLNVWVPDELLNDPLDVFWLGQVDDDAPVPQRGN
jgi:hypothetical protein